MAHTHLREADLEAIRQCQRKEISALCRCIQEQITGCDWVHVHPAGEFVAIVFTFSKHEDASREHLRFYERGYTLSNIMLDVQGEKDQWSFSISF
jgi:hypothetical protein